MDDKQYDNLPLYARREIERLRRDLAQAEKNVARFTGATKTECRVGFNSARRDEPVMYLDPRRGVEFCLTPPGCRSSGVRVYMLEGNVLAVNADSKLVIEPWATNSCKILTVDW